MWLAYYHSSYVLQLLSQNQLFFSPCHSLPKSAVIINSSCLIPSHPHTCPSTSNQYLSTHLSFFFSLWNCLPCWLRTCCLSSCLPRLQPAFEYLPLYHNCDSSWHVLSILMWESEIAARCFWFQPVEVWIAESPGYNVLPRPPAAVCLVCLSSTCELWRHLTCAERTISPFRQINAGW